MAGQIFQTKKSGFFKGLFLISSIGSVLMGTIAFVINCGKTASSNCWFLSMSLLIPLFSSLYWFGFQYEIKDNLFLVKIFRFELLEVKIHTIRTISRKRKSSYVYGLDDIKTITIHYHGGSVSISPTDEQHFIELLVSKNQKIAVDL